MLDGVGELRLEQREHAAHRRRLGEADVLHEERRLPPHVDLALADEQPRERARQRGEREERRDERRVAAEHGVEQLEHVERRLPPLLRRRVRGRPRRRQLHEQPRERPERLGLERPRRERLVGEPRRGGVPSVGDAALLGRRPSLSEKPRRWTAESEPERSTSGRGGASPSAALSGGVRGVAPAPSEAAIEAPLLAWR